jgi:hypothetical protein
VSISGEIYRGGNQRTPEIHAWTSLCLGMKVRSFVELGIGSSYLLRREGVPGVTVDLLPDASPWHIQGDSHDPATRDRVIDLLGAMPDVVFIDADHEAAMVRLDFELWWPVAQFLVGFHDILMPSVVPFWHDVRRCYPSLEIVARDPASAQAWQVGSGSDGDLACGGIGVLFKEGA